jgi:hypothetical protein
LLKISETKFEGKFMVDVIFFYSKIKQ